MGNEITTTNLRSRLRVIKEPDPDNTIIEYLIWHVGEMPVTWEPNELKNIRRRCLRKNLKSGILTKEQYKSMVKK